MKISSIALSFCAIALVSNVAEAETLSFRCKLANGFNTNFDADKPLSKGIQSDMPELIFDQLDMQKGSGRMIGNAGSSNVSVIQGNRSIHVLEATPTGNLNLTTIFLTENKTREGYPVVHSRHLRLSSGPFPSQHVGSCRKLD
jgi:hypothetical protein